MPRAWLLCCAVGFAPAAYAQPLTYSDAVAQAGVDGPTITASDAAVEAARLSIRPAGRLPDPELALGLDNVPVSGADRYRLDRDEMTMQRIGIMQEVPSGAVRRARTGAAEAASDRAVADSDIARLQARLGAARAWIALHYALQRQTVLQQSEGDARALAGAARARLAAGGSADDALTSAIEAVRAADRLSAAGAAIIAARAELRRWAGDAAVDGVAGAAPVFSIDPMRLREHLARHPDIIAFDAAVRAASAEIDIARAETHPDWTWEVAYQHRDRDFGDMASVGVRIGLPLFGRQRPVIEARRAELTRAGAERDALLREHQALLETRLASYASLAASLSRAQTTTLPLARQRAAATQAAHAAGGAALAQAIGARRDAQGAELEAIDMAERLATLSAELTLEYRDAAP